MVFRAPAMLTLVMAVQSLNACVPISLTLAGILMVANDLQPSKASLSIDIVKAGMLMPGSKAQFWNAWLPIVVTVSGITSTASDLQSAKQFLLILMRLVGRMTFVSIFAPAKNPLGSSLALVFIPSFPSIIVAPERSTVLTRHSPFFSLALVRLTICCNCLRSVPFKGPLTFNSTILNLSP